MGERQYKYRAFISYSHADEKWAAWLHKALETYRVPKYLVGEETAFGPVPARIAPIFRDREELSTATSLGNTLTQALEDSASQIVICSPRAAASRWTNEEILTFKRLGRSDRIFCLIVDGEPGASDNPETVDQECFPPALIYQIGPDGELTDTRGEPIAADARKGKDNKQNAKLKLIAGMLGVGFDSLRQREQQRRQRRLAVLAAAAVAGMAITSSLAVTAYLARIEAEEQRNRAQIEAETARQTTQFMVDLFKVSDPSESLGNTITAREILDKGAARIDSELTDQPEIQATLMDTMGTVYTSLGLYPQAADLVDKSLGKRRELFGYLHPEVAASLAHLGEVQTLSANYAAAEANMRESVEVRRVLFGPRSAEVAESLTGLGEVLHRAGDYDQAREMFSNALSIRRELFAEPHTAIAESLEDLGLNDYEQGRFDDAVASLTDALAMRRALHGELHPLLAQAIGNLAWALTNLGEFDRAESLMREGLAMKRQLHAGMHPDIALYLNNIARIRETQKDFDEAELLYREALQMTRELLGDRHPEVAVVLGNLAFVLYEKSDKEAAIAMMRDSLDIRQEVFGSEHPATAGLETSLGFWLTEKGEYAEAEALLEESLAVRQRLLGPEHPKTAGTLTVIANLMIETGRFDAALDAARNAKSALLLSLPEDHWRVAVAMNYEGLALAGLGDYEAAESLLLASLDGLENAPIPAMAENGRKKLAEFYEAWGRPQQAAAYR